jgi:hypothetical protein
MKQLAFLTLALASSVLALAAGPATAQAPPDPLAGTFANHVQGPTTGDSQWTFTPRGDGTYDATESGLGSARGTAYLTGTHLHMDFTYASGAGYYDLDLSADFTSGTGSSTHTDGPFKGQTWTVTSFTNTSRPTTPGSSSPGGTDPGGSGPGGTGPGGSGPGTGGPVVVQTIHTHMWWTHLNPDTGGEDNMETDGDTFVYDDGSYSYSGVVSSGDKHMTDAGWVMTDFLVTD